MASTKNQVRLLRVQIAVLWLFVGLGLLCAAVWLQYSAPFSSLRRLRRGPPSDVQAAFVLLVVTASFCLLLFLVTLVGLLTSSKDRLAFQIMCVVLAMTSEVTSLGYLNYFFAITDENSLAAELKNEIHYYYHLSPQTEKWNDFMDENKCCGGRGSEDFVSTTWWNLTESYWPGYHVPGVCCGKDGDSGPCTELEDVYKGGCGAVLVKLLASEAPKINVMLAVLLFIKIVVLLIAFKLREQFIKTFGIVL